MPHDLIRYKDLGYNPNFFHPLNYKLIYKHRTTANVSFLGENYVLRAGHSALVTMKERTTLLVYGRGFVPLTMGYWISETLLVNHDPLLALTTIFIFLKGTECDYRFLELIVYVLPILTKQTQ